MYMSSRPSRSRIHMQTNEIAYFLLIPNWYYFMPTEDKILLGNISCLILTDKYLLCVQII